MWLHARGAPGAHVIIQYSQAKKAARDDEEAREVDLQMAADLAAYSDLRNERKAEVMFGNPKHISKRRAPVGAVRVSKEAHRARPPRRRARRLQGGASGARCRTMAAGANYTKSSD